ncbi:MAG: GNAT family N-acetyltransferase [Vulcanimicrobiaceae bacterium]
MSERGDDSEERVNLLVELDDSRFEPSEIHHQLEALTFDGVEPVRESAPSERTLAWIDLAFGGTSSSVAAAGELWSARKADGTPLAFAAYGAQGLRYRFLRGWNSRPWVRVAGPLGVVPEARGRRIGSTLARASLYALRERGYRQALVPGVVRGPLVTFYERALGAREVERAAALPQDRRVRTVLLASGSGSNVAALGAAVAAGELPLELARLVCNRAGAGVLARAAAAGIPSETLVWDRGREPRDAYDVRVLQAVAQAEPELVLLLGWMHVLPAAFVARFPQALNLHPAFLPLDPGRDAVALPDGSEAPAFRGARAVDDALAAGAGWIGASVHRLGAAVDRGEIYARAPLRLEPGEARPALDARLHALERRVVRSALERFLWELP